MKTNRVCILGGTGFVGRHLVAQLTSEGIDCIIPSRNPQRYRDMLTNPRVKMSATNPYDGQQLASCLEGCQAAINLIGIINEVGSARFQQAHVALAEQLVKACKRAGVPRLLHMSALNANEANGPSDYLKTKGEAENRTHTLAPPQTRVTSFRPSVIFGEDDSFFNRFAKLLKQLPGPFPLACADARFAPVFVGDVAKAFSRTLDDSHTWGKHYQLCGPRVFSLQELVEYTAHCLGLKKRIIRLSPALSALQARILGLLPGKPFTYDNYLSLQVPSTCTEDGLRQLGIAATDMDAVVPFFLGGKSERMRYYRLWDRD